MGVLQEREPLPVRKREGERESGRTPAAGQFAWRTHVMCDVLYVCIVIA